MPTEYSKTIEGKLSWCFTKSQMFPHKFFKQPIVVLLVLASLQITIFYMNCKRFSPQNFTVYGIVLHGQYWRVIKFHVRISYTTL